ncbi:uncharacterized protein EV422DRAFT_572342 [Fimicolochytrium jonesii]|uniref:uncharacterized protein n=1 Tax=Fimicolochytrium jonesii TaxID=1396493 RepID=UPI0022FEE441|nr:uncharacterized protein EV422DRAFT_572342 [Fimicolochytrium jonesii]KAI8815869.1 hypothetical protein EV422DRAFT_572342 [Fimicolochytrium jonesii]
MPAPVRRTVKTLAAAVSTCSAPAAVYGQCINKIFGDVQKDSCRAEFVAFKECVTKAMKRA